MKHNRGRRQFLKGVFGGLGVAVASRVSWLFPEGQPVLAHQKSQAITQAAQMPEQLEVGELYAGFLLLPEEVPVPDFVQTVTPPTPHDAPNSDLVGETMEFSTIEELVAYIPFPTYFPTNLPTGVQLTEASVFQFAESQTTYYAIISFGEIGAGSPTISVWAQPIYSRPFPVWPVRSPSDRGIIVPEKITFTPEPGLLLPSAVGFLLLWIKGEVLYQLFVENNSTREFAREIAESLVQI